MPALQPAIVVTGASSGIGRAFAQVAAREGSCLVVIGRSEERLSAVAAELTARGTRSIVLCLDLGLPDTGARIEAALQAADLYCDVLVNSAGYGLFGAAAKLGRAQQLGLLDVNARALTDLTLRFLPGMLSRGRGGVINIGSLSAYFPGPNMALYFASKAYVRSFSDALHAEVAGTGVTITGVNPGPVWTDFFRRSNADVSRMYKLVARLDAASVAELGWRAFKAGRREIIPGWTAWIIAATATLLPRSLVLRLARVLLETRGH
jgi:short-subunit dehydrogenase